MAIFGSDQRIDQQIRETGAWHKETLFTIRRLQHGDQAWIEAEKAKITAGFEVFNLAQLIFREAHARVDLSLFTVGEIKRATQQIDGVALHRKLARAGNSGDFAILGSFQQRHHFTFVVGHTRFQADHATIDGRGQLPHFTVNTAANF